MIEIIGKAHRELGTYAVDEIEQFEKTHEILAVQEFTDFYVVTYEPVKVGASGPRQLGE